MVRQHDPSCKSAYYLLVKDDVQICKEAYLPHPLQGLQICTLNMF